MNAKRRIFFDNLFHFRGVNELHDSAQNFADKDVSSYLLFVSTLLGNSSDQELQLVRRQFIDSRDDLLAYLEPLARSYFALLERSENCLCKIGLPNISYNGSEVTPVQYLDVVKVAILAFGDLGNQVLAETTSYPIDHHWLSSD